MTVLCDPMATSLGDPLTPQLTDRLITLADGPAVRGIAVLGSAARGDASPWSDIDVEATVAEPSAKWDTRPSFIGERLIMCHAITADEPWAQLTMPDKAIWAAPSYGVMRILVDRDGGLARLRQAARSFDYEPLRPAAAAFVRQRAPTLGEYVLKIRAGLEQHDGSKTQYAQANLILRCERLVAVALLVPIRTENEYYAVVRDAAGPRWTELHRTALGVDGGDAVAHATAACGLFRETMRLVDDQLDGPSRALVRRMLEMTP